MLYSLSGKIVPDSREIFVLGEAEDAGRLTPAKDDNEGKDKNGREGGAGLPDRGYICGQHHETGS